MRLAFISDIHGNSTALEAVLADIEKRNVDKLFVLGDICYRGPNPKRSLELIRGLNTEVIKGNADEWIVRGIKEGEVPDSALEMMNLERDWSVSKLDNESIEYLKNLPTELKFSIENVNFHTFHATPDSLFEVVLPNEKDDILESKLINSESDIFIYAHIHKPFIRYINGKCIINIGSVGLPFDGNQKSSYAIVEVNKEQYQTSIVRVNYSVEKVIQHFKESDYPNSDIMTRVLINAKI